jgi:hypothetical protein
LVKKEMMSETASMVTTTTRAKRVLGAPLASHDYPSSPAENSQYRAGGDIWVLLDEVFNSTTRSVLIYGDIQRVEEDMRAERGGRGGGRPRRRRRFQYRDGTETSDDSSYDEWEEEAIEGDGFHIENGEFVFHPIDIDEAEAEAAASGYIVDENGVWHRDPDAPEGAASAAAGPSGPTNDYQLFGDAEMAALASVLQYNNSLLAITINGVGVGDRSVVALCRALATAKVRLLDLTTTFLDDESGIALLELAHRNPNLRTIVVDDTLISENLVDDIDLACLNNDASQPVMPPPVPIDAARTRYCVRHFFGFCTEGSYCSWSHDVPAMAEVARERELEASRAVMRHRAILLDTLGEAGQTAFRDLDDVGTDLASRPALPPGAAATAAAADGSGAAPAAGKKRFTVNIASVQPALVAAPVPVTSVPPVPAVDEVVVSGVAASPTATASGSNVGDSSGSKPRDRKKGKSYRSSNGAAWQRKMIVACAVTVSVCAIVTAVASRMRGMKRA